MVAAATLAATAVGLTALAAAASAAARNPSAAPTTATQARGTPPDTSPSQPLRDFAGSTIRAHQQHRTAHADGMQQLFVGHAAADPVEGMDVSGWQGNVDWNQAYRDGARFAYIKATEATGYVNPYFAQQYNGSYDAGMIRGAYHFALPDHSSGTVQADYFVDHGGGWSADGKTLPPMLDIEYNPYGNDTCYGLSQTAMIGWIKAFSDEVHARTGRWPTIYTTTDWWSTCTGNRADFSSTNPLFVARYASTVGPLPFDWPYYSFWQYSDSGRFPGDQDRFNGSMTQLRKLAGASAQSTPSQPTRTTPTQPSPTTPPGPTTSSHPTTPAGPTASPHPTTSAGPTASPTPTSAAPTTTPTPTTAPPPNSATVTPTAQHGPRHGSNVVRSGPREDTGDTAGTSRPSAPRSTTEPAQAPVEPSGHSVPEQRAAAPSTTVVPAPTTTRHHSGAVALATGPGSPPNPGAGDQLAYTGIRTPVVRAAVVGYCLLVAGACLLVLIGGRPRRARRRR